MATRRPGQDWPPRPHPATGPQGPRVQLWSAKHRIAVQGPGEEYVPCGWRATQSWSWWLKLDGDVEHRIGDAAK